MRIDRQGSYTIPVWVGLFLTGIYVMSTSQIDPLISNNLENWFGLAISAGAGICLAGTLISDKVKAYALEMVGLLTTIIVLGIIGSHVDRSVFEQFTMYGSLGAIIQIGSIRLMFKLSREIWLEKNKDN